jgi:hypothetical protein
MRVVSLCTDLEFKRDDERQSKELSLDGQPQESLIRKDHGTFFFDTFKPPHALG